MMSELLLYKGLIQYDVPKNIDWRVETPEGNTGIHAKSGEYGGLHMTFWISDENGKDAASVDTDGNANEAEGTRHGHNYD